MAQFLADIAGMLAIFAIAAGLVLLHRAGTQGPAPLLKVASLVLLVGGIAVGLCTTYYWLTYQSQGAFESVHPGYPGMMRQGAPGMGPGMMGPGRGAMPNGAMPRGGMPPAQMPPAPMPGDSR